MSQTILEFGSPSSRALREHRITGKLGTQQRAIVEALKKAKRPVSGREIARELGIDGAWKRLSELEKCGRIERRGVVLCTVTRKEVTAWALSPRPRLF
jgi:DNA-binding Lrp family transcriptional regulator